MKGEQKMKLEYSEKAKQSAMSKFQAKKIGDGKRGPFYNKTQEWFFEKNDLELFKNAVWQGYLDASRTFTGIKGTNKGEGAFLNGRRIRVSSADSLDGSIIGTAFPTRHRDRMNAYLEIFTRLINNCADIRRMGSASLDLCYVACGRLDGYLEQGLKEWDFAAGELILREAGGLATDFLGEPNYVKSGNIVSGNPTMVRNLIKLCDPQSLDAILR